MAWAGRPAARRVQRVVAGTSRSRSTAQACHIRTWPGGAVLVEPGAHPRAIGLLDDLAEDLLH
jgi:hypothetical protein